jgi:hypothetical protein
VGQRLMNVYVCKVASKGPPPLRPEVHATPISGEAAKALRELWDANFALQQMISLLNADHAGRINFAMVREIGAAETRVAQAREALRKIDPEVNPADVHSTAISNSSATIMTMTIGELEPYLKEAEDALDGKDAINAILAAPDRATATVMVEDYLVALCTILTVLGVSFDVADDFCITMAERLRVQWEVLHWPQGGRTDDAVRPPLPPGKGHKESKGHATGRWNVDFPDLRAETFKPAPEAVLDERSPSITWLMRLVKATSSKK